MAKKVILVKDIKEKKKKKVLIPIFIIAIMVLSTLGYMILQQKEVEELTGNGNYVEYNGLKLYQTQNSKWVVNVNNKNYVFDSSPDELKDVNVPIITLPEKVYLIFDASKRDENVDYSMQKLSLTMDNLDKIIIPSCLSEKDCPDIPIKDCSSDEAFYFKIMPEGSNPRVFIDGKCIVMEGDALGLSKMTDAVDLKIISGGL